MSAPIRFRQRITKKTCFFCLARALDCCRYPKKQQIISGENIPKKKTSLFLEIKTHFSRALCFCFACFFRRSHYLFLNGSKVVFITFSRNLSNVFFILSPSLTFPKIGSMIFFPECFFYRAPSLDFGIFLI